MSREKIFPIVQVEQGTQLYNEDTQMIQFKGFAFPIVSGDPSNLEEGMVWIDSTDNKLYVYYNGAKKEVADLS